MRLITAVYLTLAAAVLQSVGQQPARAAISGVVLDAVTSMPVVEAYVDLWRNPQGPTAPMRRVSTDSKGRFVFMDVEPGAGYSMTAGAAGYTQAMLGSRPGGSELVRDALRFSLADGEWKQNVSLRIWRLASISGRVTDERGDPAVGVAVRAYAVKLIAGAPRLLASGSVTTTDDRGFYRLDDLEPGRYRVGTLSVQQTVPESVREVTQRRAVGALMANIIGGGSGSELDVPVIGAPGSPRLAVGSFLTPAPLDRRPRAYPAVFYPGVRELSDAETIPLGHNDVRNGIDLRLQPVPAFNIGGRLDPTPDRPLFLRLLPVGLEHLAVGSEVATTLSDTGGTFTFLNVPAGSYTLLAQGPLVDLMHGFSRNIRLPDPPGYPASNAGGGSFGNELPGVEIVFRHGVPAGSFA